MRSHDDLTRNEIRQLIESRIKEFLQTRPQPVEILFLYTAIGDLVSDWWLNLCDIASIDDAVAAGGLTEQEGVEAKNEINERFFKGGDTDEGKD